MRTVFVLLMLWVVSANARLVIRQGSCPELEAQDTLKVERYMGIWYEYMRFPAPFEAFQECTSALYTPGPNNTISVTNEGYRRANAFGRTYVIDHSFAQGFAQRPNPQRPAELSVSFPPALSFERINYKVLGTDYDNYAVVYSCEEVWNFNIQLAWILTRERGVKPTGREMSNIRQRMNAYGADVGRFVKVNQTDCPPVTIDRR